MTWYAKPKGAYSINSAEGLANIYEMAACFPAWTDEAKAAAIGNSYHEGGLNPWRWQYDSAASIPSLGYGLFQFSPGSGYINSGWPTKAPNLSVNSVTTGALPEDGEAQCEVLATDYLHKWVSSCWRSYWSPTSYNVLYAYRQDVLNRWGTGSSISMAQFGQCQDLDAATFIFLACYEGPKVPNFDARKKTAAKIYEILTGITPPTPPPTPDPPTPPEPTPPVPIDINTLAVISHKLKKNKKIFKS